MLNELIPLARTLPVKSDEKNLARLKHVKRYGILLHIVDGNEIVGFVEAYRLKEIPAFPVVPWPIDDPGGKYLYVWAAACKNGYVKKLRALRLKFNQCEWLCWHRRKYNNRLHKERINHVPEIIIPVL